MNIVIVGSGYVGLTAGACLADMGNSVICVDKNQDKLNNLKNGIIPVYEPGLDELIKTNVKEQRLVFSDDINDAVKKSQVCFIAVGTPQNRDGSADMSQVYDAANAIGKAMNGYKVIVDKSTVPVGTAEKVTEIIKDNTDFPFDVVSNPEFLKQGNAVDDFLMPDRIIIGSDSEKAVSIMKEIYSPFIRTGNRVIVMDVKSAEMTKYASNSFLATKISFMNEIANLCEKVGADIEMVRIGMSTDTRIGNRFLFSGIGYGGSCFPKDIKALIKIGSEHECDMKLIKSVDSINNNQREVFIKKITDKLGEKLSGITFAVWGLSFKPKTNDMRYAPSVTIINSLVEKGAKIKAYDPRAVENAKLHFGDKIEYAESAYSALEGADALLLLTEWNEFRKPDFDKVKTLMKNPLIFDGRNQYSKDTLAEKGINYICIGR